MLRLIRALKSNPSGSSNPMINGEHLLAEKLVPRCKTVFDVGARTDDYLVRLNPDCHFHLFEPMAESFAQLQQKTKVDENVSLVNTALGAESGQVMIHPDTQSIHMRPNGGCQPVPITIQTLDGYCEQLGVESIGFMKIDVEGYELDVLRGGEATIRNCVRTIQFEYGGTYQEVGITLRDVIEFLGDGWMFYRVRPTGLEPIPSYDANLEDYRYSNYVASRDCLDDIVIPTKSRSDRSLMGRIKDSFTNQAA